MWATLPLEKVCYFIVITVMIVITLTFAGLS
ncbi:MAG: hypothetical protein QOI57_2864 [Rubrobacteraceae bacterium]|jgi:hypothetical protein|nr:hypothetical protein [Rubrobacteraceae bacterium]